MKVQLHLDNNHKAISAIKLLEELPVDGSHEVIIQEYSENRSAKQNRLYFKWCGEIANHMGITKDDAHHMFKERYAVPIFIRDDEGYATMVQAVKSVRRQGMNQEANNMKQKIVELTSTTDFSIKQMAEYMHDIEVYATEIGAEISFPEDLYQESLGRKR